MNAVKLRKTLLLIGGVPLLVYPLVFWEGLMVLGGGVEWGHQSAVLKVVMRIFFAMAIAYPLVYIPCAIKAVRMAKQGRQESALKICKVPLAFLALLGVLFFTCGLLES